ncbi:acetyl-CoA carboxylase biotin carboxyl carrier protein [Sporosarcina sp. 179-K 3D1 HS]|uniref:acetyl-CoA carboxylase biotin carboxyl carrier protein n=1 Tax=Sporosarcina sp. 179-K 3D1 HS TaxID=3232169 RepID=UPI0039A0B6CE
MLKIQEIREIIKLIDQSSIEKFSYESDGTKVELTKGGGHQTSYVSAPETAAVAPVQQQQQAAQQPQAEQAPAVQQEEPQAQAPAASTEADNANLHKITSPMVGTFYSASSPEAPAYVKAGDKVESESIVCIVEAMKLFNEIEAEVSGEIVEILVEDGQLVEYGQPLFLVKTN